MTYLVAKNFPNHETRFLTFLNTKEMPWRCRSYAKKFTTVEQADDEAKLADERAYVVLN